MPAPIREMSVPSYRPLWRDKITWTFYDSWVRPLRNWIVDARGRREALVFRRNPTVLPPPHAVKEDILRHTLETSPAPVFIETGTYRGDMCRRMVDLFEEIHTIELDERLAERARRQFKKWPHTHVVQGDSAQRLGSLLAHLDRRALFWLDGHFSGGETARGSKDTPLLDELMAIRSHKIKDHIILIDDARYLGTGDYPTLEDIKTILLQINPRYRIRVESDIVHCAIDESPFFPS